MAGEIFEFVAESLEERTSLSKLEARGTLRLALKQAGLDPGQVTSEQMAVTLEKVLPRELADRGIDGADATCSALLSAMRSAHPSDRAGDDSESPEAIFRRLAQG